VCTGDRIDTSSWTDDLSLQVDARLPSNILSKINGVVQAIPGLGGVSFKEARVGFVGRAKNCCSDTEGVKELGLKEGLGTFQLTAEVSKIPVWGTPTISREIDFGIVIVSVDFQVGVIFATNIRLNAQGGLRRNACTESENCGFGEINASVDPELKATFEAIACVETLWTTKSCGGVTITPLAIRANFTARLSYNRGTCSSGLEGGVALGRVQLRAEFSLDVPAGPIRVVVSYNVTDGIGQL
jgi:hypothetical protein